MFVAQLAVSFSASTPEGVFDDLGGLFPAQRLAGVMQELVRLNLYTEGIARTYRKNNISKPLFECVRNLQTCSSPTSQSKCDERHGYDVMNEVVRIGCVSLD